MHSQGNLPSDQASIDANPQPYFLAMLESIDFEKDNSFNVTKARALIKGYQKVRELNSDELANLPVLCRGAALRFLLTRLYDWLNVPEGALVTPKDPSEYISKLRFHQSVSSPIEYGVDAF